MPNLTPDFTAVTARVFFQCFCFDFDCRHEGVEVSRDRKGSAVVFSLSFSLYEPILIDRQEEI